MNIIYSRFDFDSFESFWCSTRHTVVSTSTSLCLGDNAIRLSFFTGLPQKDILNGSIGLPCGMKQLDCSFRLIREKFEYCKVLLVFQLLRRCAFKVYIYSY